MHEDRYNKKNAGTWKVVEFLVHSLNAHGESIDATTFDARTSAETYALRVLHAGMGDGSNGVRAVIVERSEKTYPIHRGVPDKFRTLLVHGDRAAAAEGGFIEE